MQLERLGSLMDQLWRETNARNQVTAYTPKSAANLDRIGTLQAQIRETSAVFEQSNMKVRMDATKADDIVKMRRQEYLKKVQQLASADSAIVKKMNLPKEIVHDVNALKAVRTAPEVSRRELWKQYEGRTFGEPISRDQAKAMQQIKGAKKAGEVSIDTYHRTQKFGIKQGQFIVIEAPNGGIVRGEVAGVLPDGRVAIGSIYGMTLTDARTGLPNGRIVDLNKAESIRVYADSAQLSKGRPDLELSVRLGKRDILTAIRANALATIAQRRPVNGSYATRDRVLPSVVDKRAGETLGLTVREGIGALVGFMQ